jgi:hypothetical protein
MRRMLIVREFYRSALFRSLTNSSLVFWAMRGGGAGSWGVIVNTTFQTYPTLHIFDWESLRAAQYFTVSSNGPTGQSMSLVTSFPLGSVTEDATHALQPFVDAVKYLGANITAQPVASFPINDLSSPDDFVGGNVVFGSWLIPASTYRNTPESVGNAYVQLLKAGGNSYVLMFL